MTNDNNNNKADSKIQLFEKTPIPKAVMTLAIPTIMSSLVMVIYNLTDTWFVGLLNDSVQNAAVTLAAPVLLAFNAVNNLFGVGTSSMMSRALGSKDYDTVYKSSAIGFYSALFCSLMFSLLYTMLREPFLTMLGVSDATNAATAGYLNWTVTFGAVPAIMNVVLAYMVRSEGAALHASLGTMSGCVLNIVLDPIFILPWGLGLGAMGAGMATFIANCVACLYFAVLLYVRRKKTYVSVNPRLFRLDKKILGGICGVGIPAAIQNLLNVTGMTILNNFTSGYSSEAVAAMGIAQKIDMVPMQVSFGLLQGIMPLISYNYASKNKERTKHTVLYAVKLSIGMLVIISIIFFVFSGQLIGFFIKKPTIIDYGSSFLRGLCFALPFLCMDFLAVVTFQACGFGKMSLMFAILRKIVFEIPAIIILNKLYPMYGLAYAQLVAEVIMAVIAVVTLMRLYKRNK